MENLFNVKGKVAIITGASSGLGRQFAKALASYGANVAIVARREEKLNELKDEISQNGAKCLVCKCDVTDRQQVIDTVEKVKNEFGTVDILVNNAGIGAFEKAEEQSDETWNQTMKTNVDGVYYFAREAGKIMIENKYGRIINIGSIHSSVTNAALPLTAYCASKGAVNMFTKALATEWAKHGITVNAIGPGYFPSEMTDAVIETDQFKQVLSTYCPIGRAGRDGELNGALLYFASEASSYTTGQLLNVDGGWTVL